MLYSGLTSYRKPSWISTHLGRVLLSVFPEHPALPCPVSGHFMHQHKLWFSGLVSVSRGHELPEGSDLDPPCLEECLAAGSKYSKWL